MVNWFDWKETPEQTKERMDIRKNMQVFDLNKQPLLRRYKNLHSGAGPVRQKYILLGTAVTCAAGTAMFMFSNWYFKKYRTTEVPITLTPEWRAAEAEKRRLYNQDVITRHKIGGPAESNPLPAEIYDSDQARSLRLLRKAQEEREAQAKKAAAQVH